jgi:transcriptional regulator with XRE-family HTH domain
MNAQPILESYAPGERAGLRTMLREWRRMRGMSQLALALNADLSQRHVSFIESGRSRPSREMVLRIAETLDMPLRARNELLNAAGFAPVYPERPIDDAEMESIREALRHVLSHHEPFPAMVLDASWNVIMRNQTSARIIAHCVDEAAIIERAPDKKLNFIRMMFAADGMKPHIRSWELTAPILIARLRREALANGASHATTLLEEVSRERSYDGRKTLLTSLDGASLSPTIPLELEIDGTILRLFNMLSTFGTPQDITLQGLRIEMSFPVDETSDAFLRSWQAVGSASTGAIVSLP